VPAPRFRTSMVVAALVVAGVGVAAGGGSSAVMSKVTLTVRVSGDGAVVSRPRGITCPSACKVRVLRGARVVLTATPGAGSVFSHWSAPCGTSKTCAVTMSTSKSARAFFKTQPTTTTTTPPPPPPPPPPPLAKAGHYDGTYSDGSVFSFDVQGSALTNLMFDFNGHCSDGGTLAGPPTQINGLFPIQSDGSFSGHITLTYTNASGSADVSGTLTTSGSGSGNLSVSITFTSGDASGLSCSSTGTWAAQNQS
jgi:List-Bact-rpt repeat protein